MLNIQTHFGRKNLKININKSGIESWTSKFSLRERKRERERERENLDVEHLDSLWEKKLEYDFWRSKCNSTHQDPDFPHSQFIPIKPQKFNLIFHTILYQLPCKDNGYKNLSPSTNFACPNYLVSQSLGR